MIPFHVLYQDASQKLLPHILKLKFRISRGTIPYNGHGVFPNKYHIYLLISCLVCLKLAVHF